MQQFYELHVLRGNPPLNMYTYAPTIEDAKDAFDASFLNLGANMTASIKFIDEKRNGAIVARWSLEDGWLPVC